MRGTTVQCPPGITYSDCECERRDLGVARRGRRVTYFGANVFVLKRVEVAEEKGDWSQYGYRLDNFSIG